MTRLVQGPSAAGGTSECETDPVAQPSRLPSVSRPARWFTVAVLAFVLALAFASWRSYVVARAELRTEAAGAAAQVARGGAAFTNGELGALHALAAAPAFENVDVERIRRVLSNDAVKRLGAGAMIWVRTNGRLGAVGGLGDAQQKAAQRIDITARPGVRELLSGRVAQYVGAATTGSLVKGPVIGFSVVTYDRNRRVNGILGAARPLDALGELFGPDDVVVDSAGQYLWDHGPVATIRRAPAAVVASMRRDGTGSRANATGLTGSSGRLVGFATVPQAGWVISVERPWSAAIGGARTRFVLELGVIAAIALVVLGGMLLALRRTRAEERALVARAARDERLARAGRDIGAAADLGTAASGLLTHASEVTAADGGMVLVCTADGSLRPAADFGLDDDGRRHALVPLTDHSMLAAAVTENRTVVIPSRLELERDHPTTAARHPEARCSVATPLCSGDRVVGVIGLIHRAEGSFAPHEIELLEALASHAGAAIERSYQNDVARERDAHAALAAAATGVGSWTLDHHTGRVWWSPSTYEIFGAAPDLDELQAWWSERVHEDDRDGMDAALRECARDGQSSFTFRFSHAGGTRVLRVHAARIREGAIAGTVVDVTAELQAEDYAHRRAEAAARLAAAAHTDEIARVATESVEELFGVSTSVLVLGADAGGTPITLSARGWSDWRRALELAVPERVLEVARRDASGVRFAGLTAADDPSDLLPVRLAERLELGAVLRLDAGGASLGAFALAWRDRRSLPPALRDDIASFASKVAQALARAQLVERHLADAQRAEQLGELAAALARARDIAEVTNLVAAVAQRVLGAQTASLVDGPVDGGYRVVIGSTASEASRQRWQRIPAGGDSHPARAFATGEWQEHLSADAIAADFPAIADEFRSYGVGAMISVPLMTDHTVVAVLTVTWAHAFRPTASEREWIATVANTVSQARQRLLFAAAAERSRRQAEALARLATAVAALREPRELAYTVAGAVLATTGAIRATVFEVDGQRSSLVRVATAGEESGSTVESIALSAPLPLTASARTQRPVFQDRAGFERDHPDVAARFERVQSSASLPLTAHGRLLGMLALSYGEAHEFDAAERTHLAAVATHVALALERAHAFHEQLDLAETLQRSMLPSVLEPPPALTAAGGYVPGTEGLLIGGDWYDLVSRDDGTALMIVGDVAGHGRDAAIIMGRLRTLGAANADLEPGALLDVLHQQCERDDTMATCVVLALDPMTGAARVANAGHPPIVVVPPDAPAGLLDVPPSLPLGIANVPYPTHALHVDPGSLLVGYTDGLVERRGESLTDNLGQLVARCEALRDLPAATATDRLLEQLDTQQRNDDSVVLAVQLAPVGAPLELRVPATPRASRMVREPLKRWLRHQGLADDESGPLLVAAGEAVANAIIHAYPAGFHGPITVVAAREHGGIVICVRDLGGWRPPRDDRGMGLQLIEALGHGVVEATAAGTTVWLRSTPTTADATA